MSNSQLILPDAPDSHEVDQEQALVERFLDASREIDPTVQITLAKRIVRPGSNRVLCLAAKTSIPLKDDEIESVSNLALRLSDGTNVVLSLSFFNEDRLGDYIPFNRTVFDPSRFEVDQPSKLVPVIVTTTMIALVLMSALSSRTVHERLSERQTISSLATHAGAPLLRALTTRPVNATTPAKTLAQTRVAHTSMPPSAARTKEKHRVRQSHTESDNYGLVPPPPAMPLSLYAPASTAAFAQPSPLEIIQALPTSEVKASRNKIRNAPLESQPVQLERIILPNQELPVQELTN